MTDNPKTTNSPWLYDNPTEPGWYPIGWCYDPEEGVSGGTAEWSDQWLTHSPVVKRGPRFESQAEAEHWIYEEGNDPED